MNRTPHPHQTDMLNYCLTHQHPALFAEMRLMKTAVAIWWAQIKSLKHILVVAPNSALLSWKKELDIEGEDDVVFLRGTREQRSKSLAKGHKWCLLNKEGHIVFKIKGAHRLQWHDDLTSYPWDAVILDESTFIKNPKAAVTKFFTRHFRDVPHRMIMCGLPNPEGPLDFFEQFHFLDGGETFGDNYWAFRAKNFFPLPTHEWRPRYGFMTKLTAAVKKRAFVLRRKHVNLDQPMIYETRTCTLPRKLRKTYDVAEDAFVLEYDNKELQRTIHKPVSYTWLRHLAGGFLEGELVWDAKIEMVRELLEGELKGEPVVIWFAFNEGLHAMKKALRNKYNVQTVYGDMPVKAREAALGNWTHILLAQPACLQYGVNLSQAQTQIYYSMPTSGEIYQQSRDRILVAGRKMPLLTIFLCTEDTVDEDLVDLVQGKNMRAVGMLDACRAIRERRNRYVSS